ncbi:SseB family protein [Lachnospiraceae bacterium OttesenSCG-928-D06]|nr:SseB family protein [Lachnospiraceae bacterium OttesenSCG-928-D06]
MEMNKTVSNPMLVGAIALLKAENTPEHNKLFTEEMLKSQFLSPVIITPAPTVDEEGKMQLTKESKIQFPMLSAKDGKNYFMAFSDKEEFESWAKGKETQSCALQFEEYAAMVMREDTNAGGFVINPFGGNLIVSKENIGRLMAAKMAAAKANQEI